MKTLRIATTVLSIDISMPFWLYDLFKRFARITTSRYVPGLQGRTVDMVVCDEEQQ